LLFLYFCAGTFGCAGKEGNELDRPVALETFVLAPGPELDRDERYIELPSRELTWVDDLPMEGNPGAVLFLGDERFVVAEHRGANTWLYDDGMTRQILSYGQGPDELLSVDVIKRIDQERFFIYGNRNTPGGAPRMLIFNMDGKLTSEAPMSGTRYHDVAVSTDGRGEALTVAIGETLMIGTPARAPFPGAIGAEAARLLGDDDKMVHLFDRLGTDGPPSELFHSRMDNKIQVPGTALGILYAGDAFVDIYDETLLVTGKKARYVWQYDGSGTLLHRLEHDVDQSWWRDSEPVAGEEDDTMQLVYSDTDVDDRGIVFLGSSNGRYPFILAAPKGRSVAALIAPKRNLWYMSAYDGRLMVSGGSRNRHVTLYDYRDFVDSWADRP
jgi:hypothetical protein